MNLALRNLVRGRMVALPSGQQLADFFSVTKLTSSQLLEGDGGAILKGESELTPAEWDELRDNCPLWFYVLREAETIGRGRLGPVGSRIVAETFHRAMETSRHSIVREPTWRPTLGDEPGRFLMTDLLKFAFEGKKELLAPLGG